MKGNGKELTKIGSLLLLVPPQMLTVWANYRPMTESIAPWAVVDIVGGNP